MKKILALVATIGALSFTPIDTASAAACHVVRHGCGHRVVACHRGFRGRTFCRVGPRCGYRGGCWGAVRGPGFVVRF